MGGSIRHALFVYEFIYMKGDNMEKLKKFRKIFAVLFSVAVLMLGSVGVLAADSSLSVSDAQKGFKLAHDTFLKNGASIPAANLFISSSDAAKYNYYYAYWKKDGGTVYYVFSRDKILSWSSVNDNVICAYSSNPVCVYRYSSSGSLSLDQIRTDGLVNLGYTDVYHVYSNYDISYNHKLIASADKTGFFPLPVVAEKAEALPEAVAARVKVILPVAVCCLALLTFSTVLLKRLPRFLG